MGIFDVGLNSLILILSTVFPHFFRNFCEFVNNVAVVIASMRYHTIGAIFNTVFGIFKIAAAFIARKI